MSSGINFNGFDNDGKNSPPNFSRSISARTGNPNDKLHISITDSQSSFQADIKCSLFINCNSVNRFIHLAEKNCEEEEKMQKCQQLADEATNEVKKMISEFRQSYNQIKNGIRNSYSCNVSDIRLNKRTVFLDEADYDPSTYLFDIMYGRDHQIYVGDITIPPNHTNTRDWSKSNDIIGSNDVVVCYQSPMKQDLSTYRNPSRARDAIIERLDKWS